ncbi:ImmA/IrrE family metallo-endopeptidase [Amycolatopsis sp. NBC_01488]|uniref:ImmA/IrrE family metallo-endopeptidase n=1 Tax=Amycolatopsis sp. NBC_01488 TaxID=2903563 RepID=UPI002E283D1E|nr:ImmA/IrrE family metallo-endopeptidase [Amycolatopsis sp. NBC_01488]
MKKPSKKDMIALIDYWRSFVPRRPMTYGQNLHDGREQAYQVRALADENTPAVDVQWLFEQTAIPVLLVPSYVLGENSGLTMDKPGGELRIFINENEPYTRQRFSVLHELKHALDFYDHPVLYAKLGRDEQNRSELIEAIANDFAAHVLMPTELVKRAWFDMQDTALAASAFNVSYEAMQTRLEKLGLIGAPKFWRAVARTPVNDPSYSACAA